MENGKLLTVHRTRGEADEQIAELERRHLKGDAYVAVGLFVEAAAIIKPDKARARPLGQRRTKH